MSTCSAMRWPWTNSIRAASTSEPPEDRSTGRPMPGLVDRHRAGFPGRAVRRGSDADMIRVSLPNHLRRWRRLPKRWRSRSTGPATQRSVLNALEERYPMLRGTIRDHATQQRRPFMRFFACEQDLSHEPPDQPLPDAVASGAEPLMVVGAIAGG